MLHRHLHPFKLKASTIFSGGASIEVDLRVPGLQSLKLNLCFTISVSNIVFCGYLGHFWFLVWKTYFCYKFHHFRTFYLSLSLTPLSLCLTHDLASAPPLAILKVFRRCHDDSISHVLSMTAGRGFLDSAFFGAWDEGHFSRLPILYAHKNNLNF